MIDRASRWIAMSVLFGMCVGCKNTQRTGYGVRGMNNVPLISSIQDGWQLLDSLTLKVDDDLKPYAFTVLTESGAETFKRMRSYIDIHRNITKDNRLGYIFAGINACALNVDQVLWKNPLDQFNASQNIASVLGLADRIQTEGGIVVDLPSPSSGFSHTVSGSDHPLIQFFNQEGVYADQLPSGFFAQGIPPGIVVLGIHKSLTDSSSGHASLVGDINSEGTVMVYHNNWYRPENDQLGKRYRYMIPISNLYHGHMKPRHWMPTAWLWFKRDHNNRIIKIKSITPGIDDLDPLNPNFTIQMAIPKSIVDDIKSQNYAADYLTLESQKLSGYPNIHDRPDPESSTPICRLNLSLTDRSVSLHDFFQAHKPDNFALPSRWQRILTDPDHPDNQERHMELYRHTARNDPYTDDYELVSFYKKPSLFTSNEQTFLSTYLHKSVFTTNHLEFNKVFCTTKAEMIKLNHSEL